MKRLSLLALCLALAAPALGCRTVHLGPNTGGTLHDALAAQRDSDSEALTPLSADDATAVMRAHRGKDKDAKASRPAVSTSSSSSGSGSGSGAGALEMPESGSFGPAGRQIRLEAK